MATDQAGPIGYEQARAELEEVVRALEAGAPTLEDSLRLWERGEELAALCARWLEGAQARLAEGEADSADETEDLDDAGEAEQPDDGD